jgi:hypothetical protein
MLTPHFCHYKLRRFGGVSAVSARAERESPAEILSAAKDLGE